MKVLALIFLLFSTNAYADLGGCVVYKAKYVLKNGTSVTGLLPLQGYDDYAYLDENTQTNKYCSDKAFQRLINDYFYLQRKNLTFDIFTELHLVRFGKSALQVNFPKPLDCAFTDSSAVVRLHLDSIKYTIFISATHAEWSYPEVEIQVLDRKTSLMMQQKEVVNYAGLYHEPVQEYPDSKYPHNFDSYFVINYNKNISLNDLKRELDHISKSFYQPELEFITSTKRNRMQIFEREKQKTVVPAINRLWKKGIICFRVYNTC